LNVVETEEGAPNGYSAPGILFLNPKAIGDAVAQNLVANQVRANGGAIWFRPSRATICGSTTVWRGTPRSFIKSKPTGGSGRVVDEDMYVSAHRRQSAADPICAPRDYSPEYWAATAGKGAAVFTCCVGCGDENFKTILGKVVQQFAYKSIHMRIPEGRRGRVRAGSALFLHSMDRIVRRAEFRLE